MNEELKKTSFYINKTKLKEIKLRCIELEINQSEFIRMAIDDALAKEVVKPKDAQKTIDEMINKN